MLNILESFGSQRSGSTCPPRGMPSDIDQCLPLQAPHTTDNARVGLWAMSAGDGRYATHRPVTAGTGRSASLGFVSADTYAGKRSPERPGAKHRVRALDQPGSVARIGARQADRKS